MDPRDVAAWAEVSATVDPDDEEWRLRAEAYVAAHPRRDSAGIAAAQRLALLRRLAAGPATTLELLTALRAVGWVGANDLENRLRDLRADDSRAGGAARGLVLSQQDGRWSLAEPFPTLTEADERAIGFAKTMVGSLHGPLATQASATLEHLLPRVAPGRDRRPPIAYRARAVDYERFEAARQSRIAVRVRYFSLNSGQERDYVLVPVEYVTVGSTVKAICVQVGADGHRLAPGEQQFAMERVRAVEVLPDQPQTPRRQLRLQLSPILLEVSDPLYQVLRERDLFGLGDVDGIQSEYDGSWTVEGTFPMALNWDVMEQLCAWAGQVHVREPLWLVNAVMRRLRAGMRVLETGGDFELVKPEAQREFTSLAGALTELDPLPEPTGPRKIAPPGRPAR